MKAARGPMVAAIALVGAFLIVEGVLFLGSQLVYPRLVTTDERLGWKYQPTSRPIVRHISNNVSSHIFINPDGFRDDPFTDDPDVVRIMVLGDSMAFGVEVDQPKIFRSEEH